MSITKETIRYNPNLVKLNTSTGFITGDTMNIIISFGSQDNFDGWQQEIDRQTSITTIDLINPVIDEEKRRFGRSTSPTSQALVFRFYNGATYQPTYGAAGFTTEELFTQTLNVRNSFWIFDYYDSYDPNKQIKLFSTYKTTIESNPSFSINGPSNQLHYQYVPISYTDTLTGATVVGYTKISFFNAKTGRIQLFSNERNASKNTGEVMCFETELNLLDNTWRYIIVGGSGTQIKGKELVNSAYVERVNDTVNNMNNQQQMPPTGNTYNYTTNTYLIT